MFDLRITQLRSYLREKHMDSILICDVHTIFYLTGFAGFSKDEREAYLLISSDHAYIFTDGRYSETVKINIPHIALREITAKQSLTMHLETLSKELTLQTLAFELDSITYKEYLMLQRLPVKIVPLSISHLRIIKDRDEILAIKKACKLGDDAFSETLTYIKEGITELELATSIELYIKSRQADISFRPIVAFGSHAAIPHHTNTNRPLKRNEFVLLDLGAKQNGYCSDMTRTIYFGVPKTQELSVYTSVLEAQQKIIERIHTLLKKHQPIPAKELDLLSRKSIIDQGFPDYPHSLGHGTGIQVHEAPLLSSSSSDILRSGMVFSIEPGIYLKGEMGVRIEDLVTLNSETLEILTCSPKELLCI